jgi:hypothetical protein
MTRRSRNSTRYLGTITRTQLDQAAMTYHQHTNHDAPCHACDNWVNPFPTVDCPTCGPDRDFDDPADCPTCAGERVVCAR